MAIDFTVPVNIYLELLLCVQGQKDASIYTTEILLQQEILHILTKLGTQFMVPGLIIKITENFFQYPALA